jgi:hypothetical protein
VVAVAVALVLTLPQHHMAIEGHARGASGTSASQQRGDDPHAVAERFAALESARYNANSAQLPEATQADYGGVSCHADLARMPATGPALSAPVGPPHYMFAVASVIPAADGRSILRIVRTDRTTGEVDSALFYLQKESGSWRVCGLYPDTQPPDAGSDQTAANGDPAAPTTESDGNLANPGAGGVLSANARGFLDTFIHAVRAGLVGTAAQAICLDDADADGAVQAWTTTRSRVDVQAIDDSAATGASARIQVAQPGHPPTTYGLILSQTLGRWCIEQLLPA